MRSIYGGIAGYLESCPRLDLGHSGKRGNRGISSYVFFAGHVQPPANRSNIRGMATSFLESLDWLPGIPLIVLGYWLPLCWLQLLFQEEPGSIKFFGYHHKNFLGKPAPVRSLD